MFKKKAKPTEQKQNEISNQEISPEQEKEIVTAKEILSSKQNVLMQIGQIQAFDFMSKLTTVGSLKTIERIKESKEYKGLTYDDADGKLTTVGSWDDFCRHVLHSSKSTIDEKLIMLNAFGEEFYEASQNIGLGVRELRKLRQLPSDEQATIIDSEAVELGDKEAIKELIEDLTADHKKEKNKLREKLSESDKQLKANREITTEKDVKLQELQEQLAVKKFSTEKWQDETKDFFTALHKVQNKFTESLGELMSLNEQLHFTKMDDRAKEAASSAFYADTKLLVEKFALTWNEIYRTLGDLEESAKPSGEWLAEMGFEGNGEIACEVFDA